MEKAKQQMIRRIRAAGASGAKAKPTRPTPWRIGLMAETLDPVLRTHLRIPKGVGLTVTKVTNGSPASKAKIRTTDIIVMAGDQKIGTLDALRIAVQKAGKAGKPLSLGVLHEGKRQMVKVMPVGPKPAMVEAKKDSKAAKQVKSKKPAKNAPVTAEKAARYVAEQNRRFEKMSEQINMMRRLMALQQQRIEMLEKRSGRRPVPVRGVPSVRAHPGMETRGPRPDRPKNAAPRDRSKKDQPKDQPKGHDHKHAEHD